MVSDSAWLYSRGASVGFRYTAEAPCTSYGWGGGERGMVICLRASGGFQPNY
nr:MAG TPA: hypothetical protein [Caudoviricetes sp.]